MNLDIELIKKIGLLLILVAAVGIVFVLLMKLKNKSKNKVVSVNNNINLKQTNVTNKSQVNPIISEKEKNEKEILNTPSTQEFLPFDDIRYNMIVLPNDEYKMIIETQSITYNLMSQEERDRVEARIAMALQSWDFDFQIYVQTRETPIEDITKRLKEDYQIYADKFPDLRDYFTQYIKQMEESSKERYNNLIKRHFIIISCNDVSVIAKDFTKAEKDDYAHKQLETKASKVISSLGAVGVRCDVLGNNELIELLYASLNKEKDYLAKNIRTYMSDYVVGEKIIEKPSVDIVLDGLKAHLAIMLKDDNYDQIERQKINNLLKKLNNEEYSQNDLGTIKNKDDELFVL